MASFNQCTFVGNAGRAPELTVTSDGTSAAKFSIAVNEKHKGKETTMWLNVVCWRNLAEIVKKYVEKGAPVLVTGRLSIRDYNDREGNKRQAVEIIAQDVRLLDSKRQDSQARQNESSTGDDPFLPDFPED
jgi:single-strand DNA-binding protein